MAWPHSPQPAPAPSARAPGGGAGTTLPVGPLVTAAGGFLTLVASFFRIMKAEVVDDGWSVWTTDPGFFGVGTWIPLLALIAGAAALARGLLRIADDTQVMGVGLLQVQVAAALFAVLLWLGYVVNVVVSDGVELGLGAFLLFVGLVAVVAGTVLSLLDAKRGTTTAIAAPGGSATGGAPGGAPAGGWGAPSGPLPHSQPPPPSSPPSSPGALIDPGTQVIPGPPPAPPRDDPGHVGGGPDASPPIPPSGS